MFAWFTNAVTKVRISWDFPRFDQAARTLHCARAQTRFSTTELSQEVAAKMAGPQREARTSFARKIEAAQSNLRVLPNAIAENERILALFRRSYKDDLASLYEEKQALYAQMEDAKKDKSDAHKALKDARDEIQSWHNRSSRTFFGNGGKRLPKHAMFGQSFGDLDSAKWDRTGAVSDIQSAARRIGRISAELDRVKAEIIQLKAQRDEMFRLRDQGFRAGTMEVEIRRQRARVAEQSAELAHLETEKAEFLNAARHRTGAASLEEKILEIEAARDEFLRSFDSSQAVEQRRMTHRAQWLAARK